MLQPLWAHPTSVPLSCRSDFFLAHQSFLCCRGTCWLPHEGHCSGFVMSFWKRQMQLVFLPISILLARLNKSLFSCPWYDPDWITELAFTSVSVHCWLVFHLVCSGTQKIHSLCRAVSQLVPSLSWFCSRWRLCIFLCWISWSWCCQLTCLESEQLWSEGVQPW